ncbi:hypothetical protein HD806DRAFT_523265 [Xylariaceae sp. AK1471]|nr:hypothetical protein HD806DRAFT_523265 [Xylariaceae sp. AK1471]
MGDIFRQASFVIAAHAAVDDSYGFLNQALENRPIIDFAYDDEISALSKRGWVLQERFLASRTIHFTRGLIYMESTREVRSEHGLLRISDLLHNFELIGQEKGRHFGPYAVPHLRKLFGLKHNPVSGAEAERQAATNAAQGHYKVTLEWLDLVEMYSSCGLKKEDDKLIAISGMARRIHLQTGQMYCAGIWADTISQELLWLKVEDTLLRPKQPRAPSWSWAAYDGPIQYPENVKASDFQMECVVVGVRDKGGQGAHVRFLESFGCLEVEASIANLGEPHTSSAPVKIGRRTRQNDIFSSVNLRYHVSVWPISREKNHPSLGYIAKDEWEGVSGIGESGPADVDTVESASDKFQKDYYQGHCMDLGLTDTCYPPLYFDIDNMNDAPTAQSTYCRTSDSNLELLGPKDSRIVHYTRRSSQKPNLAKIVAFLAWMEELAKSRSQNTKRGFQFASLLHARQTTGIVCVTAPARSPQHCNHWLAVLLKG